MEEHFTPYAVYGDKGRDGLFTGYYEPLLKGAHEKRPPYIYPLYGRPSNMYTADLGAFHPDLKGRTITGRVEGEKFVPFYKRADIEDGKLEDTPILWVDNAVDAFFLHIQGSGRVELENGEVVHAGYAAQNGHAYTAIGKPLIERGEIPREKMSMQAIRAWLEAHPDDAEDIMNINQSYVFFRVIDGEGPLGAEGVPLTPLRSMAVDRKKIPYGAPIYIDAETPDKTGRMTRLMVAQDTGGAIKGAVRGDVFWGAGAEAANNAGIMKSTGQAYILLPKTLDIPKDKTWRWWHRLQTGTPQTTVYNK
ncbi:MAG: MltA domain-containing protein [Alphaproteobacteria bacterium]|nr:MltA domain-containing protein [Alphaproteobacteria bacterium]